MIKYNTTDEPSKPGVYACRIQDRDIPDLFEDIFFTWSSKKWHYPGSDQTFRGKVLGWIGPLDRRL